MSRDSSVDWQAPPSQLLGHRAEYWNLFGQLPIAHPSTNRIKFCTTRPQAPDMDWIHSIMPSEESTESAEASPLLHPGIYLVCRGEWRGMSNDYSSKVLIKFIIISISINSRTSTDRAFTFCANTRNHRPGAYFYFYHIVKIKMTMKLRMIFFVNAQKTEQEKLTCDLPATMVRKLQKCMPFSVFEWTSIDVSIFIVPCRIRHCEYQLFYCSIHSLW